MKTRQRMKKLLLGLALCSALALGAQNYPVTAIVQVTQFSPYLEAYDDPGRVIITLLSTDARPEYQALLKINLSGTGFSLRSNAGFITFPIRLQRNVPVVLTGAQLREYFRPENLLFGGQSLANLQAGGGALPEGPVSLCVEVYDYNRFNDPPVSNTGCAQGYLLLHRPPMLLTPVGDVDYAFPQQLVFQWQSQHAGLAARYTLEVYEHNLEGMADNIVIASTQPLLKVSSMTPFYWATQAAPIFRPNVRYLVRVKADDPLGQAVFLNGGWSDVYAFYLRDGRPAGDAGCEAPAPAVVTDLKAVAALLSRSGDEDTPVQWRSKPLAAADWSELAPGLFAVFEPADYGLSPQLAAELAGLNAQSTYVVQWRRQCADDLWSEWSEATPFCLACHLSDSLQLLDLAATTAAVKGPPQANALRYHFEYRRAEGSDWTAHPPTTTPMATLTDLQPGAAYALRLRYWCSRGVWSDYTPVLNFVTPAACDPPVALAPDPLGETHARLRWQPSDGRAEIRVRYREKRSALTLPAWQWTVSDTTFAALTRLSGGAVYQYQLQAQCGERSSAWTPVQEFTLRCAPPAHLAAEAPTADSALLTWTSANERLQGYRLAYRRRGAADWTYIDTQTATATLAGLSAYTAYEAAAACQCASGQFSVFSDTLAFRTPARCAAPEAPVLTAIAARHAAMQWAPAGDITLWETVLVAGSGAVAAEGRTGGSGGPAPDPFAGGQRSVTPEAVRSFSGLSPDTPYRMALRGQCPNGNWTPYGPPLDFRTLADCQPPDSLGVAEAYPASARLYWRGANAFDAAYFVALEQAPTDRVGTGDGRSSGFYTDSLHTREPMANFTGLTSDTEYRFRVKTRCDNFGWTSYSPWHYFRTDACAAPADILETPISNSAIRLSWRPSPGPNTYEVKYRLAAEAAGVWQSETTAEAWVELSPLLTQQVYDYQIAEICRGGDGTAAAAPDSFMVRRQPLSMGTYACGAASSADLSNQTPLAELLPGDTLFAFDFWVAVEEVSGGGGYFSGTGNIDIPFFKKARVELAFNNIFVNDEYRMVGGYMEVTGAGVEVLPAWADSLLLGAMSLLQMLDASLQDDQLRLLDSLSNCCSDYLPEVLQDEIQGVLDCYAEQDQLPEPNYAICEQMLDSLMSHINDDLDSVIAALDTLIVESMTLDILRMALDELSAEHAPQLPPAYTEYEAARRLFDERYPPLSSGADPAPDYEAEALDVPPGSGDGDSPLLALGERAGPVRAGALALVVEDIFTTASGALPDRGDLKTFALPLRSGDTDVYTPIHAQVQVLWDEHSEPDFDIGALVAEARGLFVQKVTFLVHQ